MSDGGIGILLLLWMVWPLFAGFAQRERGGNVVQGALLGLLFGPLGLILAMVTGGRRCPACQGYAPPKATRCPKCREEIGAMARDRKSVRQRFDEARQANLAQRSPEPPLPVATAHRKPPLVK